jgi:hypothetical protein
MLAMRGSSLGRSTTTLSEMPALRCFFTAEGKIAELTAAYAQNSVSRRAFAPTLMPGPS